MNEPTTRNPDDRMLMMTFCHYFVTHHKDKPKGGMVCFVVLRFFSVADRAELSTLLFGFIGGNIVKPPD